MPLPIETLDDWSYSELVQEGVRLLPSIAPEWTNRNASDPGITLIELFAYFTEILIFQTGQITEDTRRAFLQLMDGPGSQASTGQDLDEALRQSILRMREPSRAVTEADFERFTLQADSRVARVTCLPRLNLAERNEAARTAIRPGHVSVVLVPRSSLTPPEMADLIQTVAKVLEPRRVLTTRVHVVAARSVVFSVHLRVRAMAGVAAARVVAQAEATLRRFFDPILGGRDGSGWPMGRSIFVSEIYEVVSKLPDTDSVTRQVDAQRGREIEELLPDSGDLERARRNADGEIVALWLAPDELPGVVQISVLGTAVAADESRAL